MKRISPEMIKASPGIQTWLAHGEVSREEKMGFRGSDPESCITEDTLVYKVIRSTAGRVPNRLAAKTNSTNAESSQTNAIEYNNQTDAEKFGTSFVYTDSNVSLSFVERQ